MERKVCFLGGARYAQPLDGTSEKKFRAMTQLFELFVIGFSPDVRFRSFTEHAHFYLLPQLPWPILRYVQLFVLGQTLLLWLVIRHRIQVVIAQSPYEGFVAALPLRLSAMCGYKARLVVEAHGDFEHSLFLCRKIRFSGLYRFIMRHVAYWSIKQADLLRAISVSTREQLTRWAPAKTIVRFPAWTDIDAFLQHGVQEQRDNSQAILYAGVLTPLKGIHHLINAFVRTSQDFPAAELNIIGNAEDKAYAMNLRKQIKQLALEERVRLIPAMPQAELATWMAKASVLVLPSLSEGLPRVIIESMATGTPVIASRVGGIPELIEDGVRGFLVPPCDEAVLAEKIHWILSNPEKADIMGKCGRVFAQEVFSTDGYLKGYKRVFEVAQSKR